MFAKYNKCYENVSSKQLQLTTVYLLTLKGSLALFMTFLTSDLTSMDTPTSPTMGGSSLITVESVKYWIIILLFRFFRGFILMGTIYLLNILCN
jgi:hypothetical protein